MSLTEKHAPRIAVGGDYKGKPGNGFQALPSGRVQYDVRCEDCGMVLGFIQFTNEQPEEFDAADSKLVCQVCYENREVG